MPLNTLQAVFKAHVRDIRSNEFRMVVQTRAMGSSPLGVRDALKVAGEARRVAVLGIKPESKAGQPAHYVPKYLAESGVDVVPVPVYFPEVTSILGKQVFRKLVDIPGGPVDIVDVFRRPEDIPQHVDDIIAAKPKVVWLQSGISNPQVEQQLAAQGIQVAPVGQLA